MVLLSFIILLLPLIVSSTRSIQRPSSTLFSRKEAILPRDTEGDVCGRLFDGGYTYFEAVDAYNCLISVPLNQTVASQFLQYLKDTLEFQSTLTYLKNPPPSYQQPPTDLLGGLDQIQKQLDTGVFSNQYNLEVAVLNLLYSAHDGHTYFYGGASNVFEFGSPFEISSVSVDGIKPPQVFITADLYASLFDGYTASPIATVNGQPVLTYLNKFASVNAEGYIESHADWNSLMYSPAADVQGVVGTFSGSSPFYPGDVLHLVFKNGTTISDWKWLAVLNDVNDAGAVSSISEFYDMFVAPKPPTGSGGELKKRQAEEGATETEEPVSSATSTAWSHEAYPGDPIVYQANLGDGGVVTGYLIDPTTAVLSIPSFDVYDEDVTSFSATVDNFLKKSRALGATKVLIDLQQNYGGSRLLATDTFKHFFPSIDPYSGSRGRAHKTADVLGDTYTKYYSSNSRTLNESFVDYLSAEPWVAPNFLNAATGQTFKTWAEYFGPHEDRLDYFTTIQKDNLSNVDFTNNNFVGDIYGSPNNTKDTFSPYDAENIVILTDGLCSSTCALFVEMMHHEAGVQTIAVGGQPQTLGPMQAVAGTRGARDYEADDLDIDIYAAISLNASAALELPSRDIDFYLDTANVNLQDQIRKGENFPLQFAYEAAACRIYYTKSTFFNMTALWRHAAQATWVDRSLCVKYSTNHPSSSSKKTDTVGPNLAERSSWAIPSLTPPILHENFSIPLSALAETDDEPETAISGHEGSNCDPAVPQYCKQLACVQAPWCSPNGIFKPNQFQCVKLASDLCNPGQKIGEGKCNINKSGKCSYCKPKTPVTSQTCGTQTTQVRDDRVSQPKRLGSIGGRRGGGRKK